MGNSDILMYLPGIVILAFASAYGMIRLFKRKVPIYFQLAVCAVGSYAIQLIYSVLIIVCANGFQNDDNLSFLGIAGMFTFLAAANYGQFNSIIDDKSKKLRPIRLAALTAPILAAAYYVFICIRFGQLTVWFDIIYAVVMVPLAVSSYFNLKFLLMKDDGSGFLRGVKPLNLVSLLLAVCYMLYIFASYEGWIITCGILSAVFVLAVASIVFLADWGRKQWLK